MKVDKRKLGKQIKMVRTSKRMTQEELATCLNVSAQAVSKWEMETCSPDISLIVPLSTLFGVSADVLFGISPDDMEKEIEETRKYCDAHQTSNEDALEAWMKLYARYPHNSTIKKPQNFTKKFSTKALIMTFEAKLYTRFITFITV